MADKMAPGGEKYPLAGLKWRGKSKDGVHQWVGKWRGAPKWFLGMFLGIAALMAVGAAFDSAARIPLAFSSLFYIIITVVMYQQRVKFMRLTTREELAKQMGMDPDELEQSLRVSGVKPSILMNDIPMYDPQLVNPASILLRPADPVSAEHLLRPAGSTDTVGLVRPVEEPAGPRD